MIDIVLQDSEQGPLYMKVYRYIRSLIEDGTLQDGTKLPSVRAAQQQLRVSKSTVENAYQLLLAEGYVYSKPRSGFVIVQPSAGQSRSLKQEADRHLRPARIKADETSPAAEPIIDFNLLSVDYESFPAKAWRSALTEALDRHHGILHEYGDPRGEYVLRSHIAQYLLTSRGVKCEPEQIVIGLGFSYSLFVLKMLLQNVGAVAVEQSSIAQVGSMFAQHGFQLAPIPFVSDPSALQLTDSLAVQAIYVTPSHRPSGKPLTNAMKERLLQWAVHSGACIIEDDYDGEFQFRGKPVPALQGADRHEAVIYFGTFSKAFTPALRMNYMVLPQRMAARLAAIEPALTPPSRMDQLAMSIFMERGHWYRHIKRIRKKYGVKRQLLMNLIRDELSPFAEVKGDGIGLHIEMAVRSGLPASELIRLASEAGVCVYGPQYDGIHAGEDRGGMALLYLGFGGIREAEMEEGIIRLKRAWSGTFSTV